RREAQGAPVGAVAVHAVAIDHEERARRPGLERAFGDASVRQVDRAADMAAAEVLGAADVEQDESAGLELGMDVPAIGLELEKAAEVERSVDGCGGGWLGHRRTRGKRGHVCNLLGRRVCRPRRLRAAGRSAILRKYSAMTPGAQKRSVAVLAYDGLCTFEFALAVEIFGLRRPELGVPWYDFKVCAAA